MGMDNPEKCHIVLFVLPKYPLINPPQVVQPWADVADTLRLSPGEWHQVAEGGPVVATTDINLGRFAAFRPKGHYQAKRESGKLLIRYVGAPLDHLAPSHECYRCRGRGKVFDANRDRGDLNTVCPECEGTGVKLGERGK